MRIQYKHFVAIIYTVVLFLDRLDLTIVNVTLPTLARYFGVSIVSTDWVSMSFLLALAVSIPISSWLGDRFGIKKMYLASIALFGIGSGLCAWAKTLDILIFFRFIQGIGGGMLIPLGMTMLYRIYDKSEYANITSFTFLPSLIAPALAPFLGGIFLEYLGWQSVFLFSTPFCLILTVCGFVFLKEDNFRSNKKLDWGGFILSSGALITLFYILSLISKSGLSFAFLIGFFIFVALTISFIFWEKNKRHPLIDISVFNKNLFVQVNLIQVCFQVCHFGAIFLIGMYLQIGVGMSASMAGLVMGMQAVGAMTTNRYSVRLYNQHGAKLPIIIGLAGIAVLSPAIMLIQNPNTILFGIILFFTRGIFSGLCGTPIQTLSVLNASSEELGQVNSIFNACRQVAISFGVALSSIFISVGLRLNGLVNVNTLGSHQAIKVFALGFGAISVIAIIGILITQRIPSSE